MQEAIDAYKKKFFFWKASHCCFFASQFQELKGKILLKAKKIGGLEKCVDETLTDEVSDEEEMANGDEESPTEEPQAEKKNKVYGWSDAFLRPIT